MPANNSGRALNSQVNEKEEDQKFNELIQRSRAVVKEYRTDPSYHKEIPDDAADQLEHIIRRYRSAFSTKLAGRPACAIDPMRIILNPGVKPTKTKPRRYPPQKQAFIASTCKGLIQEGLSRPVSNAA